MPTYAHTCTHMHTIYTHVYKQMFTYVYTCMYTHTHVYTHTQPRKERRKRFNTSLSLFNGLSGDSLPEEPGFGRVKCFQSVPKAVAGSLLPVSWRQALG